MKTFAGNYSSGINGTVMTIAHCWRITRRDGEVFGFTDFDQDLTFAGLTFKAADGFSPTDVDANLSGVPQVTVSSFLGQQVTLADLAGGLYDNATIEFMRVNWANLPTTLDPASGQFDLLVKGSVGVINHGDQKYSLQFRGLGDRLKGRTGWQCQKECRYTFGDERCGFDVASITETKTVTGVGASFYQFTINDSFDDNRYTGVTLTWLTGDNAGFSNRVIYSNGATLRLSGATPQPISIGDTLEIHENCLKTEDDCENRFSNIANYGGEGNIPGQSGFAQWGTTN